MKMENITAHQLADYLNENEDKVQELLSAFTYDDLIKQIEYRHTLPTRSEVSD